MSVTERPRIAISSCLLGDAVRWNGGHKRNDSIVEQLGARVEWMPVCPEVEIGLGTPREPIELVERDGATRMLTIESRQDLTDTMARFAERRIDELVRKGMSGYVLKKKSPSCDPDRGLFARALRARVPGLPIEDEERLQDPGAQAQFVERAQAFRHEHHG